jgi:hypothetical protein
MKAAVICASLGIVLALTASLFLRTHVSAATSCRFVVPAGWGRTLPCKDPPPGETFRWRYPQAVVALAIPVVLSLGVLLLLFRAPAWAILPASLLVFLNFLPLASIGLLYLPSTAAAIVAAVLALLHARKLRSSLSPG